MTETDRTTWLSEPTATHLAVFHGAVTDTEECWSVVYLTTPAAYAHPSHLDPDFYCGGCNATVTPDSVIGAPSDGQGDAICAACLFLSVRALATLTPAQAAALSWWDAVDGQPSPESVGAVVVRVA